MSVLTIKLSIMAKQTTFIAVVYVYILSPFYSRDLEKLKKKGKTENNK